MWRETVQRPQQLSSYDNLLSAKLPEFFNVPPTENDGNNFSPADDPQFEAYLQEKRNAEEKASTTNNVPFVKEIPQPLSR